MPAEPAPHRRQRLVPSLSARSAAAGFPAIISIWPASITHMLQLSADPDAGEYRLAAGDRGAGVGEAAGEAVKQRKRLDYRGLGPRVAGGPRQAVARPG